MGTFILLLNFRQTIECVITFVETKWNESGDKGVLFTSYMLKYKKDLIREGMIALVRKKCGLGDPPEEYTTNANEAANSKIKGQILPNGKKLTVKETIQALQREITAQEDRIKCSFNGSGTWEIAPKYRKYSLTHEQYDRMSSTEKEK